MAQQPVANPQIPPATVDKQIAEGQALLAKQLTGTPRFAFADIANSNTTRDTILNALLGMNAGGNAAEGVNKYGNPLASFLAGVGGAANAPQAQDIRAAREKAVADSHLAQLEAMPLDKEHFGNLIAKYPELEGLPLGLVNKISGVLGTNEKLMQALQLFLAGQQGQNNRLNTVENTKRKKDIETQLAGFKGILLKSENPEMYKSITDEYKKITGSEYKSSSVDAKAPQQTEKIIVKLSDGRLGKIYPNEFDPNTMTKIQ